MPTISADRTARAAAVLLMLVPAATAWAGATIEIDPRTEAFATPAACEQALEQRHSAALSRLASLSPAEKRGNSVGKLKRNGGAHLSYAERVDLSEDASDADMPGSQTEKFTCLGSTLEHRVDYEAGER